MLFADDSIIFGEASIKGANELKTILDKYATYSGQMINFDKSETYFSANVSNENKDGICQALGVHSITNPKRYLNLPLIVGRNKKVAFRGIKENYSNDNLGIMVCS